MKSKEIRELSVKELRDHLAEEKLGLLKMNLQHGVSPIEHTHKLKESKRMIARFKTELRKREIDAFLTAQ